MTDITFYWGGASDAASGSTYKIEQLLADSWTTLAASQAATTPYAAPASTLDGAVTIGDATLDLVDASSFSTSGEGFADGFFFTWGGKSSNQLTGVDWLAGYGTIADGANVYEAHESYDDTGVTITDNAVVYRITHTDPSGNVSPPAYLWYYFPPTPASAEHCVVVVNILTDLNVEMRDAVSVQAYLSSDEIFNPPSGGHLDANQSDDSPATTNDLGLAFLQCWRTSAMNTATAYTFNLDGKIFTVTTVPDQTWALLSDLI